MLQKVMAFLLLTLFVISNTGCRAQLTDGVASEDSSTLAAMAMPFVMPMLSAGFKIFSGANDDAVVTKHDAGGTNWASSLIPLVMPLVKAGLNVFNQAINAGGHLGSILRANSKNFGVPSIMDYPLRSMTMPLGDTAVSNRPGNMDLAAATGGGSLGGLLGGTLAKLGANFLANLNGHGNMDQLKEDSGLGGLLTLAQLVASMANSNEPENVNQASDGSGGLGGLQSLAQLASMVSSNGTDNVDQAYNGSGGLGSLLSLAQLASMPNSHQTEKVDQAPNGNDAMMSLGKFVAKMANSNVPGNINEPVNKNEGLRNLLGESGANTANSNEFRNINKASKGIGDIGDLLNLAKLGASIANPKGSGDQPANESERLKSFLGIAKLGASMLNTMSAKNMDQAVSGNGSLGGITSLKGLISLAKTAMADSYESKIISQPANDSKRFRSFLEIGKLGASVTNYNETGNSDRATSNSLELSKLGNSTGSSDKARNIDQVAIENDGSKGLLVLGKLGANVVTNSGLPSHNMEKLFSSTRNSNEFGVSNITEIPFLLRSSPADMPLGSTGELNGFRNLGGGLSKLLNLFKLGASMANSGNLDASSKTDMRLRNNPIEGPNRSEDLKLGKFMSLFKDMGDEDHGLVSVPNGKLVKISREIRNKLGHIREEMERKSEKELEEEELENKIEMRAKQFICKETKEGRKCMWSTKNSGEDNDK